jgi:cytochrome c oxidase assembly protein subunit 11
MECFCFQQQTLNANEARQMPVVFYIDPALPKDVNHHLVIYVLKSVVRAKVASSGTQGKT